MRTRFKRVLNRAKYAGMGAAVGGTLGGLVGRSAASTGASVGALVGATVGEQRSSVDAAVARVREEDYGQRLLPGN